MGQSVLRIRLYYLLSLNAHSLYSIAVLIHGIRHKVCWFGACDSHHVTSQYTSVYKLQVTHASSNQMIEFHTLVFHIREHVIVKRCE